MCCGACITVCCSSITRAHRSCVRPHARRGRGWRWPRPSECSHLHYLDGCCFARPTLPPSFATSVWSPWHSTPLDRQVALYLFLLTFVYSIPLLVAERVGRAAPRSSSPGAGERVDLAEPGGEGARVRRRVHGDPRPAVADVAGLHLLPVLGPRTTRATRSNVGIGRGPHGTRRATYCPTTPRAQSQPSSPFAFTALTCTCVPAVTPGIVARGCVTRSTCSDGLSAGPHVTM